MITEDYVSFETAKLLKKKGFDECTICSFDKDGNPKDILRPFIESDGDVRKPTLQMAMKWLRKEKNLYIQPKILNDGTYIAYIYRADGFGLVGHDKRRVRNNPEEACEAAIKYCLENFNLPMKTIEEKAKAYDEIIERAKTMLSAGEVMYGKENNASQLITDLIPELEDSEDEKIRKWLIDLVKRAPGFNGTFPSLGKVLAYLERQKEPKPANQKASKPVKWNKHDEEMLNRVLYRLNDWDIIKTAQGFETDHRLPSPIKWLKNKFKSIREQ